MGIECVCVLKCKQQQCRAWIHFPYLQRIFVWDFYGFAAIMYVLSLWHEKAEHLLNFLKQINDINCVLFNHLIAPFVDVCVRLCMGGVYVIGTILKKEH